MAAPKLWNNLPLFTRNNSSVNSFKKFLITFVSGVSQLIIFFLFLCNFNSALRNQFSQFYISIVFSFNIF